MLAASLECCLGNLLVSCTNGEAKPVLLDFGMTKDFTSAHRITLALAVFSVATLDMEGLSQAICMLGVELHDRERVLDALRWTTWVTHGLTVIML